MLEELFVGVLDGVGWGVGGAAVAVAVLLGGPRAKPLAKDVIKGYLKATQRVRELAAETSESVQDIYAEAKHEYESQLNGHVAEASEAESAPTHGRRAHQEENPA